MRAETKMTPEVSHTTEVSEVYLSDTHSCFQRISVSLVGSPGGLLVLDSRGTAVELYDSTQLQNVSLITGASVPAETSFQVTEPAYVSLVLRDAYLPVTGPPILGLAAQRGQIGKLADGTTAEKYGEQELDSARQQEQLEEVNAFIDTLFQTAREEYFEDGMKSKFSRELISLIEEHGNLAMQEISYLITYDRISHDVSSEALRWLGRMDDAPTYSWRLWLMERSLESPSPCVRDGAALGLASMGNPHAIPYIKRAIEGEACIELREDMEDVLEGLEATRDATSA